MCKSSDTILRENCFSKIYRILLKRTPSPNCSDYHLDIYTGKEFEQITNTVRQKYGYSQRVSTYSKVPLYNSKIKSCEGSVKSIELKEFL